MLPSIGRFLETGATGFGIAGLLVLGVLSGEEIRIVTLDLLSLHADFFQGSLTVAVFTLFVLVTGGFMLRDVWTGTEATAGVTAGPELEAIVPAYREADVVDVAVESLTESAYEPLAVTVVVEPGDRPTRARAEELAARYEAVSCLVSGDPGSKATAINDAVRRSDARYFAVFDADERVSPGFVPGAMGELLDGADVVQGRRIPRPTGAVETLAYCERIVVQAGYIGGELLGFTHCQSSSTAFTREAFETVGGYDDKLTEDIDFSHKCYRADLTVRKKRSLANTMEAPHTVADLWGQRKRWRIGHVEVFDARLREALTGERRVGDLLSIGRAAGGILGGAFLLVLTAHVLLLLAFDVESAFLIPYATLLAVIGGVLLRDTLDGHVGRPSPSLFLVPLVILGHGALTVKSFLEYYLTWEGEWYQVTKTGG